ncbi:MAG: hypothetical protein ABFS32_18895, partial [Bacteroidota bacterium]
MQTAISSFNLKSLVFVTVLLNTLILSACGGGGGSSTDTSTALDYPTNVTAVADTGTVTISWSAVTGADAYTIFINNNTYVSSSSYIETITT